MELTSPTYQHRRRQSTTARSYSDTLASNVIERTRREMFYRACAQGFPYSTKLTAHVSCVNYLVFSRKGGRWLASAGDDFRILLWDFNQEDLRSPSGSYSGPAGNVLSLDFSASNQYLISGGSDSLVLRYDMSRLLPPGVQWDPERPSPALNVYRGHDESVRCISAHAHHDELFFSAGEDGRIILHDARVDRRSSSAQGIYQHTTEFTGVQAHPVMEHVFATSDSRGQVCLRDSRMAFGPLSTRSNEGIVQTYVTKLSKRSCGHLSNPESSSVAFDRDGTRLALTMLHWYPTIYALPDPYPLAICTGRNGPDGNPAPAGERTYSNSCTMKSGAFGGPGISEDILYAAGSDDFRGYVWEIPDATTLAGLRQEIPTEEWYTQEWRDVVGYCEGLLTTRYVPLEISTPLCRLNGHRSIVNAVAIHPSQLHIVTSGIERHIMLHSPTPSSPVTQNLTLTPSEVRKLTECSPEDEMRFLGALLGTHPTLHEGDTGQSHDESQTISLFDHILREEGEGDVFELKPCKDDNEDGETEEDDHGVIDIMRSPST
ncbi:WD40 repeat-like protein [Pisolithus microcarpus]|nr:WD40 repeat-like protein [Pisolithus microcarpus]